MVIGLLVTATMGWLFLARQLTVPDLKGKTVTEAGSLLTERGLVLGAQIELNTPDASQAGKILSSTPAAGENVAAGTPVGGSSSGSRPWFPYRI